MKINKYGKTIKNSIDLVVTSPKIENSKKNY